MPDVSAFPLFSQASSLHMATTTHAEAHAAIAALREELVVRIRGCESSDVYPFSVVYHATRHPDTETGRSPIQRR